MIANIVLLLEIFLYSTRLFSVTPKQLWQMAAPPSLCFGLRFPPVKREFILPSRQVLAQKAHFIVGVFSVLLKRH